MLICTCDAHTFPHLAGFGECQYWPPHAGEPRKPDYHCHICGQFMDEREEGGPPYCCDEWASDNDVMYEVEDWETAISDFFADAIGDNYADVICEAICVVLSAREDSDNEAR